MTDSKDSSKFPVPWLDERLCLVFRCVVVARRLECVSCFKVEERLSALCRKTLRASWLGRDCALWERIAHLCSYLRIAVLSVCFLSSIDYSNTTSQKSRPTWETSASLRLMQRVRQKLQPGISVTGWLRLKIAGATKSAVVPLPFGKSTWALPVPVWLIAFFLPVIFFFLNKGILLVPS